MGLIVCDYTALRCLSPLPTERTCSYPGCSSPAFLQFTVLLTLLTLFIQPTAHGGQRKPREEMGVIRSHSIAESAQQKPDAMGFFSPSFQMCSLPPMCYSPPLRLECNTAPIPCCHSIVLWQNLFKIRKYVHFVKLCIFVLCVYILYTKIFAYRIIVYWINQLFKHNLHTSLFKLTLNVWVSPI